MSTLGIRCLTALINKVSRLLPAERRQWIEAITAEAASVPPASGGSPGCWAASPSCSER